jgi:diguanylate cyclase
MGIDFAPTSRCRSQLHHDLLSRAVVDPENSPMLRNVFLTLYFHAKSISPRDISLIAQGNNMLRDMRGNQTMPKEVANQLAGMLFGVPSSTVPYVIGLVITPIVYWVRSQDASLTAIAVSLVVLMLLRIAVVHVFKQRNSEGNNRPSTVFWSLVFAIGALYSLAMAALVARAFFVGEVLSIGVAVVTASGLITGIVIRASAVPRMAVPHLLFAFVPLIIFVASLPDRAYLVIAFLLGLWCLGCVQLSMAVHQRMKAQLLAEHQLSLLARRDYLTGLDNRASFDAHGSARFHNAQANRLYFTLAVIDLDGFKGVNDTHGHATGDELLKEVSTRIQALLGGRHFVARLGGDEFGIVFDPDTRLDDATDLGNQIVRGLKCPFVVSDTALQISGSAGIAALDGPADTFASVAERADRALYRAKNAGRNQAQVLLDLSPGIVPPAINAPSNMTPLGKRRVTA